MTVAVVTGAATGIGAAIARTLAKRGHTVVVTARRDEAAQRVVEGIVAGGGAAVGRVLDVTDRASCTRIVAEVADEFGGLDVWVSNAGVSAMTPFLQVEEEQLRQTLEVNLIGAFFCGQAAGAQMVAQGHGRIINVASMAGKMGGLHYLSDYVASKFAVIGLTRAMAAELAPTVTVNSVCPGFVAGPMQDREIAWEAHLDGRTPEQVREGYIAATPLGRISVPDDTARVVAFLASPHAAFLTGESISVNGGAYMD